MKGQKQENHRESEAILMTDREKNQIKDVYREEISQIHAPADLILRTKQAVAEEEEKLRKEIAQAGQQHNPKQDKLEELRKDPQIVPADLSGACMDGVESAGKKTESWWKRRYRRVSGWILPVTAAAALLLVLRVSVVQFSYLFADRWGGADHTASAEDMSGNAGDGSMEGIAGSAGDGGSMEGMSAGADEDGSMEGIAGSADEGGSMEGMSGSADEDGSMKGMSESASDGSLAGAISEEVPAEDVMRESDKLASAADTEEVVTSEAEYAAEKSRNEAEDKFSVQKMEGNEEYDGNGKTQLTVKEVIKEPDFCQASDTERVESHDVVFYITEDTRGGAQSADESSWKAYAVYDRKKYIITGSAADQEEFLKGAYALLVGMVK